MLNIVNRAGTLTFEIQKKGVKIAISCSCIKDEWIDLIVTEFRKTLEAPSNNMEVSNEMERHLQDRGDRK
jgi:hypothetical protein